MTGDRRRRRGRPASSRDVWVDRAEPLIRYLEVELASAAGARRRVLLPMTFAGRSTRAAASCTSNAHPRAPVRRRAGDQEPRSGHQARGGQDRRPTSAAARSTRRPAAPGAAAVSDDRRRRRSSAACPAPLPAGETCSGRAAAWRRARLAGLPCPRGRDSISRLLAWSWRPAVEPGAGRRGRDRGLALASSAAPALAVGDRSARLAWL